MCLSCYINFYNFEFLYNYLKLRIKNYMSHFIRFATIIKYNISVKVIKDSSITFILEIKIFIENILEIFIFGNTNCLNGAIQSYFHKHFTYNFITHTLPHFNTSCFTYHTHNPTFRYYVFNVLVFELLYWFQNVI